MKPEAEKLMDTPSVSLTFVGFGMRPEAVTENLGIEPTQTDVSFVRRCGTERKEECGLWSWDSGRCVSSRDIGEHIEHLIGLFRPLKSRIEEIRPRPNVFVRVRCIPISVLRPFCFTAPRIDARHIAAIAELGAALTVELLKGEE